MNTVFAVAHDAGFGPLGRTSTLPTRFSAARAHPPSTTCSPRKSTATQAGTKDGDTWTDDNALTQQYDTYKVDAITNEIAGKDHSGSKQVGVPVTVGHELPVGVHRRKADSPEGNPAVTAPTARSPGRSCLGAGLLDSQIGRIVSALDAAGSLTPRRSSSR